MKRNHDAYVLKIREVPEHRAVDDASHGLWSDPDPLLDLNRVRRIAIMRINHLKDWLGAVDNVLAGKDARAGRPAIKGCTDCECTSHCETHMKEDGTYPDGAS